jgi:hypothetical protein
MEKLLRELIGKVEVLIKVQTLSSLKGMNQAESVMALYNVGIAQKEISTILGVPINSVTSIVTRRGKPKKKQPAVKGE